MRSSYLLLLAAIVGLLVADPVELFPPFPTWAVRGVVLVKAALFLAFATANWRGSNRCVQAGLVVFTVGLLSNAIPTVAYGAMPYSVGSARRAGMTEAQVSSGSSGHVPVADIWWPLRPLADVLPVPGLHLVASVGDLLLLAGISLAVGGAGSRATSSEQKACALRNREVLLDGLLQYEHRWV